MKKNFCCLFLPKIVQFRIRVKPETTISCVIVVSGETYKVSVFLCCCVTVSLRYTPNLLLLMLAQMMYYVLDQHSLGIK